jgi:hypothetical protein
MSDRKAPDSARGYCTRASERLRLKQSIARLRVGASIPAKRGFAESCDTPTEVEPQPRQTPPTILVLGVDGVLRVKKD